MIPWHIFVACSPQYAMYICSKT